MKLKVLIILFNAILLTIFFAVFSFSFFTAGTEFIGKFLKNYWIFIVFFFCILALVNTFFFNNWKIINALECEDWTRLSVHLETEIFEKKHLTFKKVRIFSEISILLGDFENLTKLESILAEQKPKFLGVLATRFAASKLLANDYNGLAEFSAKIAADPHYASSWMKFYDAFSQQMLKNYTAAAEKFAILIETEHAPLVHLLSIYFMACGLYAYLNVTNDEAERRIEAEKRTLRKYPLKYWKKSSSKERQEIHVLVLTRVIDEAIIWLFGKEKGRFNQQQ